MRILQNFNVSLALFIYKIISLACAFYLLSLEQAKAQTSVYNIFTEQFSGV